MIYQSLHQDILLSFMDINLFPLGLIFISSGKTFFGNLIINSYVISTLSKISFPLNQLFRCLLLRLTGLDFLLTYLSENDLYHQQCDALFSLQLS